MTAIPCAPRNEAIPRQLERDGENVGRDPDLWLYRERTLGMLRRYQRLSVEVGRLPSLLGREFFRTRVTSYHAGTFEDAVIFVHDVANGLAQLGGFEGRLIAKIALQEYTQNETDRPAAGLLAVHGGRRFPEALDQLTEIFLEGGLLIRDFRQTMLPGRTTVAKSFIHTVSVYKVRPEGIFGPGGNPKADSGSRGKWGSRDGRSHHGRSGERPLSGDEIPVRDDRPLSRDLEGRGTGPRFFSRDAVAKAWS